MTPTCACGTRLVPDRMWRRCTPEDRVELRAQGYNKCARTGECGPCGCRRQWVEHKATRGPVVRYWRTRDEVLEDWRFLVDHTLSKNANIALLAPRMGMTRTALGKALDRAGVKPWPAGWAEHATAEVA